MVGHPQTTSLPSVDDLQGPSINNLEGGGPRSHFDVPWYIATSCEGEGDVVGVVATLGGVAQVIFHGVQVVEVGVQVRVHEEGEKEEDGEGQVEVEREVEENQG